MMMVNSEYTTATDEVANQLAELQTHREVLRPESAIITGEAALTNDLIDTSAVDFKMTNYISIAAIFLHRGHRLPVPLRARGAGGRH